MEARLKVLPGEAQQVAALAPAAHCEDEIVEHALAHGGQLAVDQSLLQEEAHQWCLQLLQAQLTQGLEDAREAEVVVTVAAGTDGGDKGPG